MIKVYTSTYCAWCKTVKRYLDSKGVQYETINLDEHPEIRQRLINLGLTTTPITTDEDRGIFVRGWKPAELASLING